MDDLQFRRRLYEDPHCIDQEIIEAKYSDAAKQKFAKEIEQLDEKILQALKVPVPDDMAQKLILRQALNSHQQDKKKKKVHLALAASVALAIGLTVNFMVFTSSYTTVADYAFAHTEHEADLYTNNDDATVSLASLNNKMATYDGKFGSTMGEILMAKYCYFDGMKSLHLIFKGKTSPVNVFIIPQNDHLEFMNSFANKELNGSSQQFKHANVLIVGDKSEPLEVWRKNIEANVTWSI